MDIDPTTPPNNNARERLMEYLHSHLFLPDGTVNTKNAVIMVCIGLVASSVVGLFGFAFFGLVFYVFI